MTQLLDAQPSALDPRTHAYRPDLASDLLRNKVEAERYVDGVSAQVDRGLTPLRRHPAPDAPLDSQLLSGEMVTVFDEQDGWAWVQNGSDGYVGYTETSALGFEVRIPTHWVKVLRTFIYPEPDIKTPPLGWLTMSGGVTVIREEGGYSEIAIGGWVFSAHLAGPRETSPDYTATAIKFLGTPYLWGGKNSLGVDCTGLIQIAMARAGIPCPRDSDMQAQSLGKPLAWEPGVTKPERGDLFFFPEHAAIAVDETRVVHANAATMMVSIEELSKVEDRVRAISGGIGITARRRPRLR
jgi:cell wall-associated NlpC family hydrolase